MKLTRMHGHIGVAAANTLGRGAVERQGMILERNRSIALPLLSCVRSIDPDCTRPFEDVRREVRSQAWRYLNLIVDPLSGFLRKNPV
jgi:hypothetical protein